MFVIFWIIPWLLTLLFAIKGIEFYLKDSRKIYLLFTLPFLLISSWSLLLLFGIVPL